jgi:hypothetical protein
MTLVNSQAGRAQSVVAQFEPSLYSGVIPKDFSPEEPALSAVEGIWRTGSNAGQGRVSASRQILHGLKAVQDDACW